jgi:CRISPR system Cascade subunit CasB
MTISSGPNPAEVPRPAAQQRARPPLRAVGRFVHARVTQLQHGYLQRRPAAVAALAQLRRGVGKPVGAIADLWQLTLEGVPLPPRYGEEATINERAAHTALTLYALHQQSRSEPMHRSGQSIGAAARILARRTTSLEATRRRFEALGTASSFEEVAHHARGLISQFRTHGIPLDYGRFADQLVGLLHPASADRVRLSWGRDFHRPAADEFTTNQTGQPGEADTTTEEAQ